MDLHLLKRGTCDMREQHGSKNATTHQLLPLVAGQVCQLALDLVPPNDPAVHPDVLLHDVLDVRQQAKVRMPALKQVSVSVMTC